MPTETMTFEEIISLLNRQPEMDRTLEYIQKRHCRSYRPFGGQPEETLLPWVKEHKRKCFNCDHERPEHAGRCWGNASCEIWVCSQCAPMVEEALQQARENAEQEKATGEKAPDA